MKLTPNGACGKQRDIDEQPAGGLAGKPGIKVFGVAPLVLVRPMRTYQHFVV